MINKIHTYLLSHGVKPSVQRTAIMEYLWEHRTHPTAETIYSELHPKMPTLSKMTVYNTLSILSDCGAVLALNVDEKQMHYDGDTSFHAHFICTNCRCIEDIEIKNGDDIRKSIPEGMEVEDIQLIYKGKCKNCKNKINQ